jgi:N-acetylmuramoyl-L-alanine amidase
LSDVSVAGRFVAAAAFLLHLFPSMTPGRNPYARTLCSAFAFAFLLLAGSASAASEWQVIKVGRWDYLTVDNIAKFYGFPGPVQIVNKSIRLDNGRNQLEVTLDSREAIVNGARTWLCFPVIEHTDGRYLVSRIDLAKTLEPQFRPHMIANLGRLTTVVIDPGHGGIEKGAASAYGLEKEYALDVARQLKPLLEAKGLRVIMTRTGDEQVPLPERARIANNTKDSIFVSIHFNAASNTSASGLEIYSLTPRGAPSTQDSTLMAHFANMQNGTPVDAASLALSTSVYHSMLAHMPEFDRGIKRARFAVLRLTQVPSILVEGGFLSERQESRNIANPQWRTKLAQSIAVGIENYRGLVEKKQRPMMLADYRRKYEGVLVARNPTAPLSVGAPAVLPASNQQPMGALARLTAALRRQPAAQTSSNHEHEGDEHHGSSDALAQPQTMPAASPPAELVQKPSDAPHSELLAEATRVNMPPGPAAPATQPAPEVGSAAEATTQPADQPVAAQRKYWVLKFAPPPKFRQ